MDYYKVLELKRTCEDADIKQAYRRLAIRWHPDKNESKDKDTVLQRFREISEAYTVLSSAKSRSVFDQYGEKGLKSGVPNGKGGFVEPWAYTNNPVEQFEDFFGSFSPFADFFSDDAGNAKLFQSDMKNAAPKNEAVMVSLYCSLEELDQGCIKKCKITRKKLNVAGTGVDQEEAIMTVQVQAGWREGTKITFTCEGDESTDATTGDVVFVLKEKPHPHFRRVKNDLHYTANITLLEALCGVTVSIQTLSGRVVPIPVSEIVRPGLIKTVANEGMPLASNSSQRGNLVIDFNVSYPESLTEQQKYELKETFARKD